MKKETRARKIRKEVKKGIYRIRTRAGNRRTRDRIETAIEIVTTSLILIYQITIIEKEQTRRDE